MSRLETASNPARWANYEFLPSPIIGFHGCDESVGEAILGGEVEHLSPSLNDYDWLGSGIYLWEANPERAYRFALERAQGGRNSRGTISKPFVLGVTLNLKRCLNLAESSAIGQLQKAYGDLEISSQISGLSLPSNGNGLRMRRLDCTVMNALHTQRRRNDLPAYDTVRGLFWEGDAIYPGAGVRQGNHIQICVRELSCVLGYFRPIQRNN